MPIISDMKSDFGDEFLPRRQTKYSAGYDFYYPHDEPLTIYPGQDYIIDTGIHLEDTDLRSDMYLGCTPRSSMRRDYGMSFDGEMVIDADYRGSIIVYLHIRHLDKVQDEPPMYEPLTLHKGDRFMQGIIKFYETLPNEIPPMKLRTGGIGSTGL